MTKVAYPDGLTQEVWANLNFRELRDLARKTKFLSVLVDLKKIHETIWGELTFKGIDHDEVEDVFSYYHDLMLGDVKRLMSRIHEVGEQIKFFNSLLRADEGL